VTATYAYCLVHVASRSRSARASAARRPATPSARAASGHDAAPLIRGVPAGLPGAAPPRALDAGGGLWLIVADAPLELYGAEPIDRKLADLDWVGRCAVAHETVVEHFTGAGTVVPMKLFTLFASDERARARIAAMRAGIDRTVARVAAHEEWGVRISVDETQAVRRAADAARARARGLPDGTGFLVRKQSTRDAVRRLVAGSREDVDVVFDALARLADDTRRRTPAQGEVATRLLLDAAFLVAHARRTSFRAAAQRAAARLGRDGYELTLTGPWPPYNFVGDPA
jgi:hypothetical protein